ncbi:MAG: porin [Pseudomonadota bacterium]
MRKLLLGTTALIGGAVIASGAALADAPQLSISGNMTWYLSFLNEDKATSGATVGNANRIEPNQTRGWDVTNQSSGSELHFDASGTSDGGMIYGARFDLRPIGNTSSDEAYVYMAHDSWGRIHIGQDDGAKENVLVGGEAVLAGRGGYDGVSGVIAGRAATGAILGPDGPLANDDSRIAYYSPDFNGLSFAASFAPSAGNVNSGTINAGTVSVPYDNNFSLAGSFSNSFDEVDFRVAIGADFAQGNRVDVPVAVRNAISGSSPSSVDVENIFAWEIGGRVSFGDFSFAAGYGDNGEAGVSQNLPSASASPTNDFYTDGGYWYSVGLGYARGDSNFSIGYFSSSRENGRQNGARSDVDASVLTISSDTKLAEGLTGFAEIFFSEVETDRYTHARNDHNKDAILFVVGTQISF